MIKFKATIEPGEMFDRLSILYIKTTKCDTDTQIKVFSQLHELESDILSSISHIRMTKILRSIEYQNLYSVNLKLFELVDKAKKDEVLASQVDAEVYNRFKAKQALQEKWFGSKFQEVKLGYKDEVR